MSRNRGVPAPTAMMCLIESSGLGSFPEGPAPASLGLAVSDSPPIGRWPVGWAAGWAGARPSGAEAELDFECELGPPPSRSVCSTLPALSTNSTISDRRVTPAASERVRAIASRAWAAAALRASGAPSPGVCSLRLTNPSHSETHARPAESGESSPPGWTPARASRMMSLVVGKAGKLRKRIPSRVGARC